MVTNAKSNINGVQIDQLYNLLDENVKEVLILLTQF